MAHHSMVRHNIWRTIKAVRHYIAHQRHLEQATQVMVCMCVPMIIRALMNVDPKRIAELVIDFLFPAPKVEWHIRSRRALSLTVTT